MSIKLRIAVVNLQSGIGTTKGYWEYVSSAWKYVLPGKNDFILLAGKMLKEEKVDIVLLTEVNEISFRSGKRSQIEVLKEMLVPMEASFFPTIKTKKHIHEGNAIFSRFPIRESGAHPLPRFTIPRYMGETRVMIDGQEVSIFVTHLSLTPSRRLKQLKAMAEILKQKTGPMILGGDFNAKDGSILESLLSVGLSTIWSEKNFPSWKPTHSLDYLLLSDHFSHSRCYVPESARFSDHAPIIIETELEV